MTDNSKLIEAALLARDLVLDGWCQKAYWVDQDGTRHIGRGGLSVDSVKMVCLGGAREAAVKALELTDEEHDALRKTWHEANDHPLAATWNDSLPPTKESQLKVADTWDKTARWLKEQDE